MYEQCCQLGLRAIGYSVLVLQNQVGPRFVGTTEDRRYRMDTVP